MREGDLLFKDLDCDILCEAIEGVTSGYHGAQVSHVGILDFRGSSKSWVVIEAIGHEVQASPIDSFFKGPLDDNGAPKILLGRIKNRNCHAIHKALMYCNMKVGTPYDVYYMPGADSLYCSELLYYAFDEQLFSAHPMTFKHPENPYFYQAWKAHFESVGKNQVPEGELGTNPGALSKHPELEILHIFGQLDGLSSDP